MFRKLSASAILPLSYTVNCSDTWIAWSFPICLGWAWKLVIFFFLSPALCSHHVCLWILKITHGEMERTAETQTSNRSCRNFKRSPWVLFHPSNTVSLYKIKTVLYEAILNSFCILALPVFKSSCEVYVLNACPCTHSFKYSFWIYHAVFLQPHCRPLWKDHHRS